MKSKIKILAILLTLIFVVSACGGGSASDSPSATPTPTPTQGNQQTETETETETQTEQVERPERVLRLTFGATLETYNPHRQAGSYELMRLLTGNLYHWAIDPVTQKPIYYDDLADGPPIMETEDHLVWTLKMKPGFTFEDGTPIDMYTLEYSIKMLNDPLLLNRNSGLYVYEGGQEYQDGLIPWEEVEGFKVIDQYTLQVTFLEDYAPENENNVKSRFSWMGTGLVHPETYEACMNEDRTENSYGTTLDKFVASGCYRITSHIEGQFLELTKWFGGSPLNDIELYTADRIQYTVVNDDNTRIQLYENNEIDTVSASAAQFDDYPDMFYTENSSNYGIFVNPFSETAPILQDVNFRLALYWGIDRESIVGAVYPVSVVNAWHYPRLTTMPDPNDPINSTVRYRDTPEAQAIRIDGHEVTETGYNPELALEYFEKAYEANGGQKVTLEVQYSDAGEQPQIWAEAIQENYQNMFGIDRLEITLRAVPWAIAYENMKRTEMAYELCAAGGIYENYTNPWSNTNWISSGPQQYSTQYCSITPDAAVAWDELFHKCNTGEWRWDTAAKNKASALMEEILFNDATFIPVYSGRSRSLIKPWLESVLDVGHPDLGAALWQAIWDDEYPR